MFHANPAQVPASGRRMTLYLPGLFSGPTVPQPIRRLLARADHMAGHAAGSLSRPFAMFGIDPLPESDWPVAAVARIADMGVIDRDWWIRADPVYLEPRRDRLIMHRVPDLSADEASRLVAELNESLVQDGWLLKAPHPERWYLKPVAEPSIVTTPLPEALGRDIDPLLPKGPDRRAWHTRLNEMQILLHTATANAERERRGQFPANSIWFWGGGRLPRITRTPDCQEIWADNPLYCGLARLAGIGSQSLPEDAAKLLEGPLEGHRLVALNYVGQEASAGPMAAGNEAAMTLLDSWLEPLLAAVNRGQLSSLSILSDVGPEFRYLRRHRWRFWRRRLPAIATRNAA